MAAAARNSALVALAATALALPPGAWLAWLRVRSTLAWRGWIEAGVWALLVLLTLDNVGVQITTLVAGLGIGGIAVALAAQNVLRDLFASLAIVLDRPFVVGDFIIVGDFTGAVERGGIKTTRVGSL